MKEQDHKPSTESMQSLIGEIKQIIHDARAHAVRSVDFCRVQMYWAIGQRIVEKEQQGRERADYGTYLIKRLAQEIEPEYGSGFGERQLKFCRQFYKTYPNGNALRSQLNWSQYRMLIQISDPDKREYYELEAVNEGWTGRQLERQKQLFMLQQENKDKEANPLTQNYQNTLNLIYLSEALYLSNIGATDKPYGKGMSVAPMIV